MKKLLMLAIAGVLAVPMFASVAQANTVVRPDHPCHPHADTNLIIGSRDNDRLAGTNCADSIYGLAGRDLLIGRAGEDILRGGRDNDRLRAYDGERDRVNGGSGFDRCTGDAELDVFVRCEVILVN